ncbi:hypothetical protein ABPG77_003066 [Micractinium sp. CCAP 211/92]
MTSPEVCGLTLLGPDFAKLDVMLPEPLCTPSLGLALRGEGCLPSPGLRWTPRTGKDDPFLLGASAKLYDRPLGSATLGGPSLPIAPLSSLALPELLHANFMMPTMPSNSRPVSANLMPTVPVAAPTPANQPAAAPVPVTVPHPLPQPSSPTKAEARRLSVHSAAAAGAGGAAGSKAPGAAAAQAEAQPLPAEASSGGSGGGGSGEGESMEHRLTLDFLEEHGYFDMPIQQAAAELRVGVTTLKKVCRVNSIGRWPFRKRSSLNRLIEKTREYFASDPEQCREALAALEEQRSVLKAQQGEDIPDQVKRYRQSIFKLDYKVKKIAKEKRGHKGAALAAADKAQVVRQLGVVTPANSILGILGCQADPSSEVDPGLCEMETSEG